MRDIIKVDFIDQYNKLFGLETLRSQVAVVGLIKGTSVNSDEIDLSHFITS